MEDNHTNTEGFSFSPTPENPPSSQSSDFRFEPQQDPEELAPPAVIKVVGVGGGGGNVVTYMAESKLPGVQLIATNTDIQDLAAIPEPVRKLPLGTSRRRGLGAGMNPAIGEAAAKESITEIEDILDNANLVFIVASLGGGTGSGAAPIIAQVAREKDALTIAIVTLPLMEEQAARKRNAELCVKQLHSIADSVVCIPNDKLSKVIDGSVPFTDAFNHMNNYLADAVRGVASVINTHGLWNLDYKDVESVLASNGDGITLIGKGLAAGQNRAENAVQAALNSPLMEDTNLNGARNVLYNIRAKQLSFDEVRKIMGIFHDLMGEAGGVYPGVVDDPSMGDELELTVLLTGVDRNCNSSGVEYEGIDSSSSPKPIHNQVKFRSHANTEPARDTDSEVPSSEPVVNVQPQNSTVRKLDTNEIPSLFRDQAD